jgi:hypothetical protein
MVKEDEWRKQAPGSFARTPRKRPGTKDDDEDAAEEGERLIDNPMLRRRTF